MLVHLCSQKGIDQRFGQRDANDSGTHTKYVHVVVLDALSRRVGIVAHGGAYARDLVGSNRRTDSAATNDYAAVNFSGGYGTSYRRCEVREIVIGIVLKGPVIDRFMAQSGHVALDVIFKIKTGVVTADGDLHGFSVGIAWVWGLAKSFQDRQRCGLNILGGKTEPDQ
jgi:hypothetical protein